MDLDQLLDMNYEQLMNLVSARARRRFSRGKPPSLAVVRNYKWSLGRIEEEAVSAHQATTEGEKGGSADGKAGLCEDTLAEHDHRAGDDRQCCGYPSGQDLQPGGDQGVCVWLCVTAASVS